MPQSNDPIRSILKNDPDFAGLDFATLRAEGIGYVGELAGKVWTDHNVHDPGITLLELLCYALMDLGYRTRMPAIDLFSRDPDDTSADDNFFTPAQILTCNPVTIMDFRKLLIDIKGVKNAWLEVNDEWIDCPVPQVPVVVDIELQLPKAKMPECRTYLNGLYKIFIELNKGPYVPEPSWPASERERIGAIVERVREVLMAHRNLCEDFISIRVLCKEKIGVCADIELEADADAEKIYVKIIETLRAFFSPDPKFYTLPQLLDKGMPIDEAFAGRPFLEESHGFVDAAELEAIPLRKEIHVSDVYNALFQIKGIRTIRKLRLRKCGGADEEPSSCEAEWKYFLTENHTPEFSLDCSGFRFTRLDRPVTVNEKKYKDLFALNYSYAGKLLQTAQLPALDLPIPQGIYRDDLSQFYSIQNELPFVYGVSEGGIPDNAPDLRKAQALQLKGYLLFFDQLFANYLSQLGQMRKLFALKNSKDGATYFSALPLQVPHLDQLLRFDNSGDTKGVIQAIPVNKSKIDDLIAQDKLKDVDLANDFTAMEFVTASDRDAAIYLLMDDFGNKGFTVYTVQNSCGCWFFYIYTSSDNVALIGRTEYDTEKEARLAAGNLAYIGGFNENYKSYTIGNTSTSYFHLELGMAGYSTYLQRIAEDKTLYGERRQAFLDHLLSRFSESFTDFALLSFDTLKEEQLKQQELVRKSNFLSAYDVLGRDRGKGYDYKLNGWNNNNISGFEQRVRSFAGMGDCCGETLCHFEVFEYTGQYYWTVAAAGQELFKSTSLFDAPEEAAADLQAFAAALKDGSAYTTQSVPLHDAHALAIDYKGDQIVYPLWQKEEAGAAAMGGHLQQLVSGEPAAGDIVVSSQIYRPQLLDDEGTVLRSSRQSFENFNKAISAAKPLIKKINEEDWEHLGEEASKQKLELKADKSNPYQLIDIAHFGKNVTVCPDEYRWQLDDESGQAVLKSNSTYPSRQQALEAVVNELTAFEITPSSFRLYEEGSNYLFELKTPEGAPVAASSTFVDEVQRAAAIEFVQTFCTKERTDEQYTYSITGACHWQAAFEKDLVFQSIALLADEENAMNSWRKEKRSFRKLENYVWDWNEKGEQQLSVKSDEGVTVAKLVAQSAEEGLAEEIFDRIQASLNAKTFTAAPVHIEQGFGFYLRDGEGMVMLSGYLVYKSRGEAFFTLLRALDKAGQEPMYLRSGDEGNRQFTFFLKGDEKQFLAEHQVLYDSDSEREEALQRTIRILKEKHSPADAWKEPIRHTFSINTADRPLLQSVQKFASIREAGEAANLLLLLAADVSNYQAIEIAEGAFELRLVKNGDRQATAPGSFADATIAEGARNEAVRSIRKHLYKVQVAAFDHQWRFKFALGLGSGRVAFQSADEYESADAAVAAYKKLSSDIPNLRLQRNEKGMELSSRQKTKSPVSALLQPEIEGVNADAALAVSQVLYQLAHTDDMKALQKMVKKDALAEQGTWVYRLLNRDNYFAYHLNCGSTETDGEKIIKNLHTAVSSKPEYLLICLGGDNFYKRTNTVTGEVLYHYTIKARNVFYSGTKELVLFISTKGYVSQDEARKAFDANYLLILKRASQSMYYGDGKLISLLETASGTGDSCRENSTLVYVPAETVSFFGGDAGAVDALVQLSKSYPVRLSGTGRYKFSLYDYSARTSYFISAAYYSTPAEAMQAFFFMLVLGRNRKNYYWYCDENTGHRMVVVREVLLESTRRYPTSDEAWGEEGVEKLIGIAQTEGSFHISVNRDDCCFSFFVACKSKIIHPCTYDTVRARDEALKKLYNYSSNYSLPPLPEVKLAADELSYEVWMGGQLLAHLPRGTDISKGGICTVTFLDFLDFVLTLGKCIRQKNGKRFSLTNREGVEVAYLDNPVYTEDEWPQKLVELALAFPIFRKDGLFYFRLPFAPEDDSMLDPCGCGQELPPDGPGCPVAWIGGCYNTCYEAVTALNRFIEVAKDESRYRSVFDCSCGAYRIEFIGSEEIVAVNPQCYSTREMVCDAVERAKKLINCEGLHLVEHILLRPRCNEHCGCLIPSSASADCHFKWEIEDDDPCTPAGNDPCFTPGQDPYSCIATIVLPAWTKRFRKTANRELVNRILYREAPSHILLRILWVSPKDCYRFEGQFRRWLRWLANKPALCGDGFDMCSFIGLLFEDRLDCWWPQEYCAPCVGETAPVNPCAELNSQQERAGSCNLTINDIYGWTTPDCCYEYPRMNLLPEDQNEKIKTIRKRTAAYIERLNVLHENFGEDAAIGLALSYIKGNSPDEEKLARVSALLRNREASPEVKKVYEGVLNTVVSFYLDRSLLDGYDSKKLSDIGRAVSGLGLPKGTAPMVLNNWNAGEVNAFVHPKTVEALNGIFKN